MALMALLTLLLGQYQLSSKQIIRILDFYLLVSASLVILGLFFSRPITEDNETRNVVYLFGLAPDPNNLLTLYSVCFSISIYYALFLKRMRIINYVLTLLSVYVIFNTGSRSGIIILLFLTSILFWYGQKDKPLHSKVKITIVAILILFVIYLLLPVFLSDSVYDRIMGKGELAFMDSTGREVRWSTALNEWLNSNILFGLGLGSAPAHSTFITMLVALGIIGYTFFLIFIFGTVIKIIRQGNVLALLLFVSPMLQSFFIDAQNKRFFWNGIIFPYLLYNCIDKTFVLKDHSLN
ncbi:O-antigen ligase family protein [Parabacteroides sp. An277]|uniref:O-antigen ligase family protein n=1 Tax=Parabacteroides sp. An277 TaxID=1965619 RepID=UPI0013A60189|nr:O-antigen ligase family protein [Parabacteroides sp. An277]